MNNDQASYKSNIQFSDPASSIQKDDFFNLLVYNIKIYSLDKDN